MPNPFSALLAYLLAHWRGQQSLNQSFWLNLVGIRLVVFGIQQGAESTGMLSDPHSIGAAVLLLFLLHAVLLFWQVAGVVRSAEAHYVAYGNAAILWGIQASIVLLLLLTALYALEAVQSLSGYGQSTPHLVHSRPDSADSAGYRLTLAGDGLELLISGDIEHGMTRAVEQLLGQHPQVRRITLDSSGGNVFEGRGLSVLIARQGKDTHVQNLCASACTTAYIGGRVRTAAMGAKLGFHQYRLLQSYPMMPTSVAEQQQRDQALFVDANVEPAFVKRMFEYTADDMWWPDLQEMLAAGVVHDLM